MVETDRIERVRIVEDGGPANGATVTQEVLTVGEGSLFPLQTALGYDLAQHLFIGDTNLLVEGPGDFVFLDAFSRALREDGRAALDERWRILPTGGAANIPAFVSLMGQNLDVTVLIDSGTEGAGRLQKAVDAARIDASRIVQVGEVVGRNHADIEDLFDRDEYLALFNAAFGTTYGPSNFGHGDRVVECLTKVHGPFDHYKPADALLRNPALLDGIGPTTLDAFERLINRINLTMTTT